jgi:hypothetical protein
MSTAQQFLLVLAVLALLGIALWYVYPDALRDAWNDLVRQLGG